MPTTRTREHVTNLYRRGHMAVSSSYNHVPSSHEMHPTAADSLRRQGLAEWTDDGIQLTEAGHALAQQSIARELSEAQVDGLRRIVNRASRPGPGHEVGGSSVIGVSTAQALRERGLVALESGHATPTMTGRSVFAVIEGPRVEAARLAEEARVAAREQTRAARHAMCKRINPEISADASPEAPQAISERDDEPRFTDRVTGVSPRVAAHIELAARLDELEGQFSGADNAQDRALSGERADELTRTLNTLLEFGVIEAPVPTTDYELALLRLAANDRRHRRVTVGEAADEQGRWTEPTGDAVMVTADVDALGGLWRRDLVAYVGGGEFALTERGRHAVEQADPRAARRRNVG